MTSIRVRLTVRTWGGEGVNAYDDTEVDTIHLAQHCGIVEWAIQRVCQAITMTLADIDVDFGGDGINVGNDNCPSVANAGQSDNEPDGIGHACDADNDNDDLSDTDEAAIGSDRTDRDTDDDGYDDGEEAARGRNPLIDETRAIISAIQGLLMVD